MIAYIGVFFVGFWFGYMVRWLIEKRKKHGVPIKNAAGETMAIAYEINVNYSEGVAKAIDGALSREARKWRFL